MIVLISSANTMTAKSTVILPYNTIPRFKEEADKIVKMMLHYSSEELSRMFKINNKLANLNYYRYRGYFSGDDNPLESILAYAGIVYKNINPKDFTKADFLFAQETLRISSFLYGLLCPFDLIMPYRMEPNIELTSLAEGNLYPFWREKFTKALLADLNVSGNVLINLASTGNFNLFAWKELAGKIRIITPEFKIRKGDKMHTPVVYIKMARGQMTRYIIKNKITDPEALKSFRWEGFEYKKSLSGTDNWIFLNG